MGSGLLAAYGTAFCIFVSGIEEDVRGTVSGIGTESK